MFMDDKRKCKKYVEQVLKYRKSRSKHTMKLIRYYEKLKTRNILQEYQLCESYKTLCFLPFDINPQPLREYCNGCHFKLDNNELITAIHSKKHGQIIWGKVYDCRGKLL